MKILLLLYFFFVLSACTTTGYKGVIPDDMSGASKENQEGVPVETIPPPVETKVFYTKPIVKKLLKKAKHNFDKKNYHVAVNLLEQAIDISPNNPVVWQRLAMVRLKQQNYAQAEQLAVKSNVLGESNDALRMTNWQIIAEAKRSQAAQ